jgi:NADPH:quinone reductase-like Zn-dependent oxidoreductase
VRTQSEQWRQQLDELVGSGPVHIAIDAHGGPFTRDLLTVIAPGGTVLIFGDLSKTGRAVSGAQSRGKRGTPLFQLGKTTPHAGGISV